MAESEQSFSLPVQGFTDTHLDDASLMVPSQPLSHTQAEMSVLPAVPPLLLLAGQALHSDLSDPATSLKVSAMHLATDVPDPE